MPGLPALFDLSGRVAVVTGGGGALGRVVAVALAEAVAVVDLTEAAAAKVAAGLPEASLGRAIGVGADLSSEAEGAFDWKKRVGGAEHLGAGTGVRPAHAGAVERVPAEGPELGE
jgi:NAD(P)-dependent dehydrogenase (short-subunit alcohol dehydrogenase family)